MDQPGATGAGPPAAAHVNVYDEIAGNRWRTWLLVGLFVAIVALLGYVLGEVWFGGNGGLFVLPFALAIASISGLTSYFAGDKIVLGMSQAHEVSEQQEPQLHHVVEELVIGAGIPKPKIYVIEDSAPNAFATGRDPKHSSVAVTRGLLTKLDRTELQGVIAHELSHVRNFDIRLMLIVAVLLGMAALLSDWIFRSMFWGGRGRDRDRGGNPILLIVALVLAVLTPIIAQLIQLAVSRQREYMADASGALLTRYPAGLANALRKIAADKDALEVANKATAPLYIANPLHDEPRFLDGLFDTHPPIQERIKRLEAM
ncbi:MAG: zinc metalloprotease HtpX [Chloroflexi bacterium]|nr:MAG: zinc metalloprotease HtpX [Chloroflexota bacterium]